MGNYKLAVPIVPILMALRRETMQGKLVSDLAGI